ncbi:MAG: hypothetical protein P8Z73_08995, partial [Desulfobacteraceae bacterium]
KSMEKGFRVHSRKVIFQKNAFPRGFRMYLEWQPLIFNQKFPFQSFDNTFADVTKGSDIIRIDLDFYGCQMRLLLFSAVYLLSLLPWIARCWRYQRMSIVLTSVFY